MPGYELTPSPTPMRELRSLTTDEAVLYLKHFSLPWMLFEVGGTVFIMNSKTRSRKIVYLRRISETFRSFTTHGFNGVWFRGWKRNHLSFVLHNSCLFLPSDSWFIHIFFRDSWFIHIFFRDSWFISHCFIQKAENDLKLYMLFCFAPCVKLMFWYKISLTLTNQLCLQEKWHRNSILCRFSDYQLSEQIIAIVYVFRARKFIVHTFVLHTCSIKNDPKSYFVGYPNWK